MKIATLVYIIKDGKVLMGEKKVGEVGTGTLAGSGGKLNLDETLVECAVRETLEEFEIEIDPAKLELTAVITFFAAGVADFKVHIYRTSIFKGEAHETLEMKAPTWYDLENMPYDRMLDSDNKWFPKIAKGEKFNANVYYKQRAAGFQKIEFLPFSPTD